MKRGNQLPGDREDLTSNMEDYLEAIYEIGEESAAAEVRVTDIASRLKVSRPSVVGMVKHLDLHGLVTHDHYGKVRLTAPGLAVARDIQHRHRVLQRFLEQILGLDAVIAERDACRMEHTLSPETIDRFIALEEFREKNPQRRAEGDRDGFRKFLRERKPAWERDYSRLRQKKV